MKTGFTLIEVMIAIAIVCIIAAAAFGPHPSSDGTTCVGGYKFARGGGQVFNEHGVGIPCGQAQATRFEVRQ